MDSKRHFTTFLQGIVVVTPAIVTAYICVMTITWLDKATRSVLTNVIGSSHPSFKVLVPGVGVAVAVLAIYFIGMMTRNWLFRKLGSFGEAIVTRIPLVKSLYSAVKDLMQFVGGDQTSHGVPARIKLMNGEVHLLGIITQKQPESLIGEGEQDRVAIYLPMSLQIGGFTFYVPSEMVEEIPDMSVETVMKLSMTAGVGKKKGPAQMLAENGIEPAENTEPAEDAE
jgi:uncharacterized membrane protein